MALTIQEQQLQRFFEVLASSKLPSELDELLNSPTNSYFLAIQSGVADAKKIRVPLLRGMLGTYNAATNTPTLANNSGMDGDKYIVAQAGTVDFGSGAVPLNVNDIIEQVNGNWQVYETRNMKGVANGYVPLDATGKIAEQFLPATGVDKNYTHTQGTPASVWNITHNLGKLPSVSVLDSANDEVEGEINHIDTNSLTLTFNAAFSGTATLN